jgi:hypothetical protein
LKIKTTCSSISKMPRSLDTNYSELTYIHMTKSAKKEINLLKLKYLIVVNGESSTLNFISIGTSNL